MEPSIHLGRCGLHDPILGSPLTVDGESRSLSRPCQAFQNQRGQKSQTQIKIDSIPRTLPSFHSLQAKNMALPNDTKIHWGTSNSVKGRMWESLGMGDGV